MADTQKHTPEKGAITESDLEQGSLIERTKSVGIGIIHKGKIACEFATAGGIIAAIASPLKAYHDAFGFLGRGTGAAKLDLAIGLAGVVVALVAGGSAYALHKTENLLKGGFAESENERKKSSGDTPSKGAGI